MNKKIIEITIHGVINCDISKDEFADKFIEWLESNKWAFGGTLQEYDGNPKK